MKREIGFYWVKFANEWVIGNWDSYNWLLSGFRSGFYDVDFQEIDENIIIKPNQQ